MDINDLFENIAKIINQFSDEIVAERAQDRKPITGRNPESEGKNLEKHTTGEKQGGSNFPNET
jgi:hypothetical protein